LLIRKRRVGAGRRPVRRPGRNGWGSRWLRWGSCWLRVRSHRAARRSVFVADVVE